jgi:glycosyltransferase involved in cell wall biosynthesis
MTAPLPRVSVLMPVYNGERFLRAAIESVCAQTYADWEFVVVDDASNDTTATILAEYGQRDPRVRVFRQDGRQGTVAARNRAFREACSSSEYFALLDADDEACSERLSHQVAFLQSHPDHVMVGGHTAIIDEASRPIGVRKYPLHHADICAVITRYNPFAQPAVMLRRAVLEDVGEYDPHFSRCQDYDLWLRIASRHKVANLDEIVLRYRISPAQAKQAHLRESLSLTLELQRRWLFHPAFFRPLNVAYVVAEHALQLLPEAAVLALFKRVTYRQIAK